MTDLYDLATERREEFAEALSWTSGEFTRYAETADPDHNRWSWRGDGHSEAARQQFRDQADALARWLAEAKTVGTPPDHEWGCDVATPWLKCARCEERTPDA